jgi:hypothetical protein
MYCFVLCILVVGMFSVPCVAQVQPGSTGGSIGKTDKSISGRESNTATKSRSRGEGLTERVTGGWNWTADCSTGHYKGAFDLSETSRGHFSGSFSGTVPDDIGTITDGVLDGASISFTRTTLAVQYWKGRILAGRIEGSISGTASCRWNASRR